MSYRGPHPGRITNQLTDNQFRYAGQTATWRQYISASAGVSDAGFGSTFSYRQQTVTAIFGQKPNMPEVGQNQTPAGQIEAGRFFVTTRERLGIQDELIWQGDSYRVESDSIPSRLVGLWVCEVKRGQ